MQEQCVGDAQAVGRAIEDVHGACGCVSADAFAGHADGEIIEAVVVEVAGFEGCAELIARLRIAGDAVLSLVPQLVVGGGDEIVGAVQHVHGAGAGEVADGFVRHADGDVVEAIAVEVACGDGAAEDIALLGALVHAEGVLVKQLGVPGLDAARCAVQQADSPDIALAKEVFARHADGDVGEAVAVEVGTALCDARRRERKHRECESGQHESWLAKSNWL